MATPFSDPTTMLSCLTNFCSLEPEEILNDILQDKHDSSLICRNCDEFAKATYRCKECDDLLCICCVRAHRRVKLTKEHCIFPIGDQHFSPPSSYSSASNATSISSPSHSMLNGNTNAYCDLHLSENVRMYCDSCNMIFCQECTSSDHRAHNCYFLKETYEYARNSSRKLLSDSKKSAQAAKDCLDLYQRMLDTVNIRTQKMTRDIRNMIRKFQVALEEREVELLAKLEKIRFVKYKAIQQQIEGYRMLFSSFAESSKALTDALEKGDSLEVINVRDNISAELKRLRSFRASMPHVDDVMSVIQPDCSLLIAVSSIGDVTASAQTPSNDAASVNEFMRNFCINPPIYYNRNSYHNNDFSIISNNMASINNQDKSFNEGPKFSLWTGGFYTKENPSILFTPKLNNSPNNHRDYTDAGEPILLIGGEGEQDGQLCRPWGVCCSLEGNIIVADRSNNRIQIFRPDGTFLRKFGSHGSEPGYFDRPAGVSTDFHNRIIVTDKDNHRVQVFTHEGKFIFTFGEKGSKMGQFNYPWDVDVGAQGRIVVSDTRNHRIQLFDNDGQYLAKYGFENTTNMVKHFDSPRGVCFGNKGCVIVTDFNNHRLVVIDPSFRNAKFLGNEGCAEKQFLRPQGVAVDSEGNIVVADSRNNRIQIFEQNGSFLHEFGSSGKEPGQLDRPSGICLTPNGKIAVVDFGNNRVQVF